MGVGEALLFLSLVFALLITGAYLLGIFLLWLLDVTAPHLCRFMEKKQ